MLFGKTVAVNCENHTEHTDTVRTSQETHYVSATEPNWLMLFGETVAVYCENHTEHTGNTSRLRYKAQPVNAVWGNSRCLL
jgi:thioredoxin-related protein